MSACDEHEHEPTPTPTPEPAPAPAPEPARRRNSARSATRVTPSPAKNTITPAMNHGSLGAAPA